jgi:hypothetical protein
MSESSNGGFGKFVPGFEFMQNLARQAAGGLSQGVGQALPQLPNLSSWVAPTFNVEDLEKRIEELKAVHFWLDQNTRALSATIQALEVQKMTLSTLQGMNFSLGDVANALKIKAADTMASVTGRSGDGPAASAPTQFAGLEIPPRRPVDVPAPAATPAPAAATPAAGAASAGAPAASGGEAASGAPAGGVIDPMQWWGALSQQFQTIAANAMKDASRQTALDAGKNMATAITREAMKTATDMTAGVVRSVTGQGKVSAKPVAKAPAAAKGASKVASQAMAGVKTAGRVAAKGVAKAATQTAKAGARAAAKAAASPAKTAPRAAAAAPRAKPRAPAAAPRRTR